MFDSTSIFHSAAVEAHADWEFSFDYLADPLNLGKWALGCFNTTATDTPDLVVGKSLVSGAKVWVKIVPSKSTGVIDYHVGTEDILAPRVSVRVIPGSSGGRNPDHSLITLQGWRAVEMDDDRWKVTCTSHEVEVLIIKSLIEDKFKTI
jgi:hypothetical protein